MSAQDVRFNRLPAWKHGLALAMVDATVGITADVMVERVEQVIQWGGEATDDQRDIAEWSEYIHKQLSKLFTEQADQRAIRQRFVKVAALAFAAIESMDRVLVPEQEDDEGCGTCPACLLRKALSATAEQQGFRVVQLDGAGGLEALLSEVFGPRGRQPG